MQARKLRMLALLPALAACSGELGGPATEAPTAHAVQGLVAAARPVATLTLAVTSIVGGGSVTGSVTLTGTDGTTPVTLSVDAPSLATLPAVIQIPSGLTTGAFTIATAAVTTVTTVHVTATAGGASAGADLVLQPTSVVPSASAVINDPGCVANTLPRNDDGSTPAVTLPSPVNFFGTAYTFFYINNNGNVTFRQPMSTYTPFTITATTPPIIAPFFADVDTRGTGSSPVTYSFGPVQFGGRPAMCVNWVNVGYYANHYDKLNSFQLLLVDRSDQTPGDFDIVMNYDRVAWETGDASGGVNGFGGTPAGAGYSAGTGVSNQFYQFPGSLTAGGLLDTNPTSGLTRTSRNSLTLGRHVFEVRNGGNVGTGAIGGTVKDSAAHTLSGAPVQACRVSDGRCVFVTLSGTQGQYEANGLVEDDYTVTAFAPAGSGLRSVTSAPVHVSPGAALRVDLTLTGPTPPPPGVTLTPSTTSTNGLPSVYYHSPLVLTSHGCSGGTATYTVTTPSGRVLATGPLSEGLVAGTFTANVPPFYPNSGPAHVHIHTVCPDGTNQDIDFDIYIDPSGLVRTTTGLPIVGAVVTLFRADNATGPFEAVPAGSAVMSPMNRDNPMLSDSIGHFGWDVISGYYKVRAQADGCTSPTGAAYVETDALPVPPAISDLDLRLQCPDTTAPVTTAIVTGAPNAAGWYQTPPVVLLSAVDEAGGSGVASVHYALSGASSGSFDVTGASASVSPAVDGATTLAYYATDNAGNVEAAHSMTLALDATPPSIACSATPSTVAATGALAPVHVAVTSSDATSGVASVVLTSLQSDVPLASGDTQGFAVGGALVDGQLRAGPGARTYTLTYTATDVAGNSANCTARVEVTAVAVSDSVAPRCSVTGVGSGRQLRFSASDAESGLAGVRVVSSQGAAVTIPSFTPGSTAAVIVTGAVTGTTGSVVLEVSDVAGNKAQCAASLLSLSATTRSASVSGVLGTQTNLTVYNGKPGLKSLEFKINGSERELENLKDSTVKSLDISKLLKAGSSNKVSASVDECGKTGSADVLLWSGPASATPSHP